MITLDDVALFLIIKLLNTRMKEKVYQITYVFQIVHSIIEINTPLTLSHSNTITLNASFPLCPTINRTKLVTMHLQ